MNVQKRKELLVRLGKYMAGKQPDWMAARQKAFSYNNWFIPEFIELALKNISDNFLQQEQVDALAKQYALPDENRAPKKIGIVMAGNIPLVGFHDFLCVFLTGHIAMIKPSSKDEVLLKHLVEKLHEWDEETKSLVVISEIIRNCDAYIATGSKNSSRYFEYYFSKYPSIIRKNRTSVAILSGNESEEDLDRLADDVYQFFGLGCRNVTKIYVPEEYDFKPLLQAFRKYNFLIHHNKYKNNYDYNLAIHLLNHSYYMSNESILLLESPAVFSPIAQLHYEFYTDPERIKQQLENSDQIQCIAGTPKVGFGGAQTPGLFDFADGIDTMAFLLTL